MTISIRRLMPRWCKVTIAVASLLAMGLVYFIDYGEEKTFVNVSAVHYYPENFRIEAFYIDGHFYGASNFEGPPGTWLCCVWLPLKWKPGIFVDVRWVVGDWTRSPISDKERFDVTKLKIAGIYRARVEVEPYTEADDVYAHFFPDGKVRIVSGTRYFEPNAHAESTVPDAEAVKGIKIAEIFTPQEEAARAQRSDMESKENGGWR